MAGRLLCGLVIVVAIVVAVAGCGGGQDGQVGPTPSVDVSPTAMPTAAAAVEATPTEAPITSEEYWAEMAPLVAEGEKIFHGPWREILETTDPPDSDAYREAVIAKIDNLRARLRTIEAPDRWAETHKLMVDSLREEANSLRGEASASDVQDLQVALQEGLGAIAKWDQAVRQMPLLNQSP